MKDVGCIGPAEHMPIGFPQFPSQEDEPEDAKPQTPVPWLPDDMIHIGKMPKKPKKNRPKDKSNFVIYPCCFKTQIRNHMRLNFQWQYQTFLVG